jgi:hypothetical protein
MAEDEMSLLPVEDDADGEALTLRAFDKHKIGKQIVVTRNRLYRLVLNQAAPT